MVVLASSACAQLNAGAPATGAESAHADRRISLPVTAEELMPLEPRHGVYRVIEGPEQGAQVPFTFEQHGNQWILTKQGVARHELHRDQEGNLLIDRETDLREARQIEYMSPVLLLPAAMDGETSLTGPTHVIVRSTRARSTSPSPRYR